MSISLSQKIEQLKARYQGALAVPADETLAMIEALKLMLDIEQARVTALGERMLQFQEQLQQLERTAPTYKEPRG